MRTGPMQVGWIGILQTIVDGIKLLSKGVVMRKINLASSSFLIAALISVIIVTNIWLLIGLSIIGYGFMARVYYSECIYSMLRGLRAVVGMMSYEILLLMVLVLYWNVYTLIALFVFSVEVRRTPTDLVEGESELVGGFNTEYAGGVFVGYFLGEYLSLIIFFSFIWIDLGISMIILGMCIVVRSSYPRMKYQEIIQLCWRVLFWIVVGFFLMQ